MIAFLVTHLMGAGHLVRTLALARAVAARGGRARVISGGRPLAQVDAAGVELVQLPWVASDGLDYRRLLAPDGRDADAAHMEARRAAILGALEGAEALVTELWPFGRRILADEFRAAVAAMEGRPVWASIRDVLEPPSKPVRVAETLAALGGFRGALVHGDPAVAPLSASWPAEGEVRGLRYTGYVADPAPPPAGPPEVL
ncbi:MAG: glycosyltransferase, partial [Paracoccaceae bacterium]